MPNQGRAQANHQMGASLGGTSELLVSFRQLKMSKLGSLFGGGNNSDSNDALKYSAPKEPKKSVPNSSKNTIIAQSSGSIGESGNVVPQTTATISEMSSKIMNYSQVRLFKINPTTNSYEAHEGGGVLGCVLMGAGINFQLLIYNGQKIPQATVILTAKFPFNIRDLYISFGDAQGNKWSILFENADIMHTFLRHLMAIISHLAMSVDATEYVRCIATCSNNNEEALLTAGMAAGIYYSLWELGTELTDYPNDNISGQPYMKLASPSEIMKLKVGTSSDFVGGVCDGLIGCRKGDKVWLGIPPKLAYCGGEDLASRIRPSAWLLVEVDVIKVKSSNDKEDKKKSKKSASKEIKKEDENNYQDSASKNNDILSRMANLSQQNGGAILAQALGRNSLRASSNDPIQAEVEVESITPVTTTVNTAQHQYTEKEIQYNHRTPEVTKQHSSGNDYAITVMEGQEAKSYYSSAPTSSYNAGVDVNVDPKSNIYSNSTQSSSSFNNNNNNNLNQVNQSLISVQGSLIQLHNKIDQMSMQVFANQSMGIGGNFMHMNQMHLLQQQQQQQQNQYNQNRRHINPLIQTSDNHVQLRKDEIFEAIEMIVNEYETIVNERNTTGSKDLVSRLEEKIETLQTKVEKLMNEKQALLEKHADMLQLGADSSTRTFSLQQEIDLLKKEKQQILDNKNNISAEEITHHRAEIEQLRNSCNNITIESNATIQILKEEMNGLRLRNSELYESNDGLHQQIELKCAELVSLKDIISTRDSELTELQSKLNNVPKISDTDLECEIVQNFVKHKVEEAIQVSNSLNIEKIKELEAELNNSNTSRIQTEDLKALMQDIFLQSCEAFTSEDNDNNSFSGHEVCKKLKGILKTVTNSRL